MFRIKGIDEGKDLGLYQSIGVYEIADNIE